MSARCAIYFAPAAETALWRFGSRVLGYDAHRAADVAQTAVGGLTLEQTRDITADPRKYGFHGTLKAPFRLAEGCSAAELAEACATFAGEHAAPVVSRLVVEALGPFVALVPGESAPALHALAAAAVRAFEPFRAPLTPEEIARRRPERLSDRERGQLLAWGYPYIFDDFRFHMTLTGSIAEERTRADVLAALREAYAQIAQEPVAIDALALFEQPGPNERFVNLERFPFAR